MAVLLTISETLGGGAVGDSLQGGGSGVDLGAVINNYFSPIGSPIATGKANNQGAQTLYISHDAADFPITDVGFYIASYTETGFSYGGADSAANDLTTLIDLGNGSGSSKNNADGLSGGLWIDMDADATTANQFDQATFPALVKIFGDGGTDGIDLASAFTLKADAMVYDAPGETLATTPVDGQIGKANDTVLGEAAKIKLRIYLPNTFDQGGYVQAAFVVKYSFTS